MNELETQANHLNKTLVRESFSRAASHYDEVAVLQRAVADNILERLDIIKLNPDTILDIGTGTGYSVEPLLQRYSKSNIILFDIAPGMLQYARTKQSWFSKTLQRNRAYLCGDAELLPIADNSVELIFSSLTLQWCENLHQTFAEFKRVLKPNGLLMFSTFGPDTLKELRNSWQEADENTHVHHFTDMHDIGDALLNTGFSDPVIDVENFTLTYSDVFKLMHELKTLGAHNVASGRSHSLTGRQRFKAMENAYEKYRRDEVLPATYEVVFGHAWSPTQPVNQSCSTVNVEFPQR